jgi:hypothetical protein
VSNSFVPSQTGEIQVFGPKVLKDAEKQVEMVCESLKVAQAQQKSYADKWRRDLSFEIGDFVSWYMTII